MRYNKESCAFEISLLELCTLSLRSGDLDRQSARVSDGPIDDKAIYYKLQSEAGGYYNPDMTLCIILYVV